MPSISAPFFGLEYGWAYGEDGWNTGMDLNILRLSFLSRNAVNEFVTTLPAVGSEGYSCILTSDNLAYFWNNGSWIFTALEVGYQFRTLSDGKLWRRTTNGYIEVPSSEAIADTVGQLVGEVDSLAEEVTEQGEQIELLQGTTEGIVADASSLPVPSEDETKILSEWMSFVRERENHEGSQLASTISDFSEAVGEELSSTVISDTLDIAYDADNNLLRLDSGNLIGAVVTTNDGVLTVPQRGSLVVELTEDITQVDLPPGDFGRTYKIRIQFEQSDTAPFSVTGWSNTVEWATGNEPVVSEVLESVTVVDLVNIDNRGWVGFSINNAFEGIYDPAGSADTALTSANEYTDLQMGEVPTQVSAAIEARLESAIPVPVEEDANIPNNSFFVDSVDDVLKFKDSTGTVSTVTLS